MNNFGAEPSWDAFDCGGYLQVGLAICCVALLHLCVKLYSHFSDDLRWIRVFAWARWNNLMYRLFPTKPEDANVLQRVEFRLSKLEYTLYDLKEFLESLQTEMRDLKSVATEAIELPNNVCEVLVDVEDSMKTLAPKLERLSSTVKHRIDNQKFVLQCMYYSLDEQFLLLCHLAYILEEAVDPTSPYPFTLRLAHRPRGSGARPRNRQYY